MILLNRRGLLPSICLYGDDDESGEIFNNFSSNSEHFLWTRQTSLDFEPQVPDVTQFMNPYSFVRNNLLERAAEIDEQSAQTNKYRRNYYNALIQFCDHFKLRNFGMMEREPIVMENEGCILILNVISAKKDAVIGDGLKLAGFSWGTIKSMNSNVYNSMNHAIWLDHEKLYDRSMLFLRRGLYICNYIIQVSVSGPSKNHYHEFLSEVVLVQRFQSNLPPIIKLREKHEVDELEHEVLLSVIEDNSLMDCNKFTKSLVEAFQKFEVSIKLPITINALVSVEPTSLDNYANFLIIANVIPLGEKMVEYDKSMFEFIPLTLFEMIHGSIYGAKKYTDHFRKMRQLKVSLKNLVKPGNTTANPQQAAINLEMKEVSKKFNDAKWTRQGLNFALGKEKRGTPLTTEDSEAALKREISPF